MTKHTFDHGKAFIVAKRAGFADTAVIALNNTVNPWSKGHGQYFYNNVLKPTFDGGKNTFADVVNTGFALGPNAKDFCSRLPLDRANVRLACVAHLAYLFTWQDGQGNMYITVDGKAYAPPAPAPLPTPATPEGEAPAPEAKPEVEAKVEPKVEAKVEAPAKAPAKSKAPAKGKGKGQKAA